MSIPSQLKEVFYSRKGAKPQRVFSLPLHVFLRQPFISLRLSVFAAWPAALRGANPFFKE
jgi:hypothetical protein